MKLAFWRRIAAFVVVCLAALIAAPAVAQFTAVSASQLGGTGNLVANATIYFQPMQSPSGPVGSARIDTTGGQMLSLPYLEQVRTGVFWISIPDALASNPTICYAVTVIDNVTLNVVLGAGMAADGIHVAPGGAYGCVQPTGSTWSFDTYTPTGTGVPLQVAGPPGATGVTNWRGAWAATTAYAKNDGFVQAGNGYIVTTAYTSGSSFGSTDTTNSVEISTGCPLTGCTMTGAIGFSNGTVAASTNLNMTGVTQTGTLGTSSQVSTFPGTVAAGTTLQAGSGSTATVIPAGEGIWKRIGVTNWAEPSQEQTVWQEGGCQILTQLETCFKRTYSYNTYIYYQESADGITWSAAPGVYTGVAQRPSRVIKIGSTYYMFAGNNVTSKQIDEFTSTDGENYTLFQAAVVTCSMVPSGWPNGCADMDNVSAVVVGPTLYLFVNMGFGSGLWSSTDYHTFTPVSYAIPQGSVRSPFYQVGNQWYTWIHEPDNQIHRMTASVLAGPWTEALSIPDLSIQTLDEGVGELGMGPPSVTGQVADPYVLPVTTPAGQKTFLWYTASQYLCQSGCGGSSPHYGWYQELKLAIADMPMTSLVLTNGGDDVSNLDIQSNLPMRFDYLGQAINFTGFSVENLGNITANGNITSTGIDGIGTAITFGCSPSGVSICNNGTAALNFDTAASGTAYNGSIVVSPSGGAGMTFTLPRTVSGAGYFFNDHSNNTLLSIDSFSGILTMGLHTKIQWGSSGDSLQQVGTIIQLDATPTSGMIEFSGNYFGTIAQFTSTYEGTAVFTIPTTGIPVIPGIKSTTGDRYVCVDTGGNLVSSATACSGT